MQHYEINIASDFSRYPGPRRYTEGKNSAEEFLEHHVFPLFQRAVKDDKKLIVNFDGTFGYAVSFIEGTINGLVRAFGKKLVLNHIYVVSEEAPMLIEEIYSFIEKAE